MKKFNFGKKVTTLILGLLITISSFAMTGTEIAQAVKDRDTGDTLLAQVEMILIGKSGNVESTRKLQTWSMKYDKEKDLSKVVMAFATPASIKDTRFLQVEKEFGTDDDKWIYLPALGRVRRISSSDKSSKFVGSDMSYGDMETREVFEDTHKLLREEKFEGYDCYVVESTPKDLKDAQYSKRVSWVIKDNLVVVKADLYSKKTGKVQKRMTVKNNIAKVQGIWTIFNTTMVDLETGHKTELNIIKGKSGNYNLRYNGKINPKLFTQTFLKTGKR